ncbi:MAG: YcjF family protein [marine benthic group bacterium]|nr:YcjF family protein [Gemmatimonadota bacterium]
MTAAIDRTFTRLGWALLSFLVLAFLLFMVNQTAGIVELVSTGWNPEAGRIALWVLIGLYVVLLITPVVLLFRLPAPLSPPELAEGPEFEAYLDGLRRRLAGNPRLAGMSLANREEIETALDSLSVEADREIQNAAGGVFLATAISQSGRLDAFLVLGALMRLVWRVSHVYWQRPTIRDMGKLYMNVAGTAFVAAELDDVDVATQVEPIVSSVLGAGVSAIPGFQVATGILVNSVLTGTANGFLTLRVGVITRRYCSAMVQPKKRTLRHAAAVEAAGMLGGIVVEGTRTLAVAMKDATVQRTRSAVTGTGTAVKRTGSAAKEIGTGFVEVGSDAIGDIGRGVTKGVRVTSDTVSEATRSLLEALRIAERRSESAQESGRDDTAGESDEPGHPTDV